VYLPQLATWTTQYLQRMARTKTASPQRGERNHPLHAYAVQESPKADGVEDECDVKDKIAERQFYPYIFF